MTPVKDHSQEINQIIKEGRNHLGNKLKILNESDSFDADTQVFVNNINKSINALETYNEEIKSRPDVILNFKKRANEIWLEIEKLE